MPRWIPFLHIEKPVKVTSDATMVFFSHVLSSFSKLNWFAHKATIRSSPFTSFTQMPIISETFS
jgi:hypothetical protein